MNRAPFGMERACQHQHVVVWLANGRICNVLGLRCFMRTLRRKLAPAFLLSRVAKTIECNDVDTKTDRVEGVQTLQQCQHGAASDAVLTFSEPRQFSDNTLREILRRGFPKSLQLRICRCTEIHGNQ